MTQYLIKQPLQLRTEVTLPASKSISNRVLAIRALTGTDCPLQNTAHCDDTRVMREALLHRPHTIDIGAAGTAMRFLTALLAATPGADHILTGTERMRNRPIGILVDALRALGASIDYVEKEGYPPLHVTGGRYQGGTLRLPGHVSSQYISALLLIGPVLTQGLTLELIGDIISRPYIDLTLRLMRDFGAVAEWTSERTIRVAPGGYRPTPYYIESDWSAASYWYQQVALSTDEQAEAVLPGLFADSYQGDSLGRLLFEQLGVSTAFFTDAHGHSCVRLRKNGRRAARIDHSLIERPDLAQTFVVTCAMLGIPFRFSGLQSLRIKETDRLTALQVELRKLGFVLHEEDGSILRWDGETCAPQPDAAIDTYEDHRMAMAFAPCALTRGHIRINHPEVVSKSYPRYWDDLAQTGYLITPSCSQSHS